MKTSSALPPSPRRNGSHRDACSQDTRPEGEAVFKSYFEKLKDPRWQKKRLEIMERDSFTCRDCGATEKTLNVHHCYYAKGGPWETASKFLLTLCEQCHGTRGIYEDSMRRMLCGKMADMKADHLAWFSEQAKKDDGYMVLTKEGYASLKKNVAEMHKFFE